MSFSPKNIRNQYKRFNRMAETTKTRMHSQKTERLARIACRLRFRTLTLPLVPAIAISLYWVLSLAVGDSTSVAATYRHGDFTYFPALAGIARLTAGESLVWEHFGEGIRSFPIPGLLVHGLAIRLFGATGFAVADVLTAICVYLASQRLFRSCGLTRSTSEILSLLVSCGLLAWPGNHLAQWIGWPLELHLWGLRFPRPFLTDLLMLLCVGSCIQVFVRGRHRVHDWVWLGVWFALLLQSRFYSAATVGLGIGIGLCYILVQRKYRPLELIVRVGSLSLATGLTAFPFIVQRWFEQVRL